MGLLLKALREATKEAHLALNGHRLLAPLQQDTITFEDYLWCLRAFHQAYKNFETVFTCPLAVADSPSVEWLEKDMQVHGIAPYAIEVPETPRIDSYSRFMGHLYVKQGSTLGGQVISRHLEKHLGLKPGETNYFFAGYGEDTSENWKRLVVVLEDPHLIKHEAVEQAVCSFTFIRNCCDQMLKTKESFQTPS